MKTKELLLLFRFFCIRYLFLLIFFFTFFPLCKAEDSPGIKSSSGKSLPVVKVIENSPSLLHSTGSIKIIVPYSPGTGIDLIARTVVPELSRIRKQAVIVENHQGASGNIGAMMVAKSLPDGLTLMVNAKTFSIAPMLYKNVTYDPVVDFTPITLAAYGTSILVTHPKSGFSDFREFIQRAKAQPGALTYASAGLGTSQHISMELLKDISKIDVLHIPYKGSAGALNDLLGGQVSVSLVPVHVVMPHVNSGRLIALALASAKRNQKAPSIQTFSELGLDGAEADIWYGFWGPKSLPTALVKSLNNDLKSILLSPQVRDALEKQGLDVNTSSPEELQNIVIKEIQNVSRIIEKNKISLN
ncbi:MAG: tripartite tricarboxylate transporter substrate-binding protein [Betaproteobacteria bacterium]